MAGLCFMKPTFFDSLRSAFLLRLTGALVLGGLAGGCAATPPRHRRARYVDDATITTQVKSALSADQAVASSEIHVETVKCVVQLSGFVSTPLQRSAAEKDASSVRGVEGVLNQLVIK